MNRHLSSSALCCALFVTYGAALAADPLPRAEPANVGFSAAGLQRIDRFFADEIAKGRIPGAVVAIARAGKLVYYKATGFQDKDKALPMRTDTIFQLASMTKPMVVVGALTLLEEGRLPLSAPLANFYPQFKAMQVGVVDVAQPLANDPLTGKPQSIRLIREQPKFECGGGCAFGTAPDYLRFGQMLLNGGILDGQRVLSPKTVRLMTSDHLGKDIKNNVVGTEAGRAGYGFGLGVAVRLEPGVAATNGTVGDYSWNGANGTSYWADPREQLVVVTMTAGPGEIRKYYREQMAALVYGAMEK